MSSSTLLLSPEEAAARIGVSPVRIRQFCREGRIGQKVGKRWVIFGHELREFAKIPRPTGRPANATNY